MAGGVDSWLVGWIHGWWGGFVAGGVDSWLVGWIHLAVEVEYAVGAVEGVLTQVQGGDVRSPPPRSVHRKPALGRTTFGHTTYTRRVGSSHVKGEAFKRCGGVLHTGVATRCDVSPFIS
eukprot:8627810-Pyramimonas_sp.AAC.1